MSFTPIVRSSNSIPKTLTEFSKDRNMDVKELDFELISYETLLKSETDDEYQHIADTKEISLADKQNPTTLILQEYSIKIKPFVKQTEDITLSLETNKLKTKAVLTIKAGSILHKSSTFIQNLKNKIWLKKLQKGLLIDIFEDALDKQLAKLFKVISDKQVLNKDLKFLVAIGVEPIPPIDATYHKVFEELNPDSNSIIDGVKKGILVFKYIKPILGTDGRACNGKYIQVSEPQSSMKKPTIDDTILSKEHKEYIEYFADDDGYVVYTDNKLTISKTLKLDGANFKTTANIDSGEGDESISVHIEHDKCHSEDAVGSGVNIDVKELNVEGSVASNVKIATQELNIEAQTHKNSHMKVEKTANIKLHRGDLVANEANIDVLESGKVTAHKSAHVRQMVGGTVIAPIVKVDEVISNSTIIASELIEIKTILGFDNKLIIDSNAIESYHKEIETLQERIKNDTKRLDVQTNNLNAKIEEHASRADRIKIFQQRVVSATKNGRSPVKQDILRIKQYKKESDALQLSQTELEKEKSKLQTLQATLEAFYNQDLNAKITCRTTYDGSTQVIFKSSKTQEEIKYTPEGTAETISIILNDNQDRIVKIS